MYNLTIANNISITIVQYGVYSLIFYTPYTSDMLKSINETQGGYWNALLSEKRSEKRDVLPGIEHGNPSIQGCDTSQYAPEKAP